MDNKPQLLMSIGIPGSGKSTYLKKVQAESNATYISPDNLREQILGDPNDQSENDKVWEMMDLAIKKALQDGQSVILDATQTISKIRRRYVGLGSQNGAKVIGVFFDVPLEVALERNSSRGKKVPQEVIEIMYQRLQKKTTYSR